MRAAFWGSSATTSLFLCAVLTMGFAWPSVLLTAPDLHRAALVDRPGAVDRVVPGEIYVDPNGRDEQILDTFIPASDAASLNVPTVAGDGAFVEIFLGVGGGVAPLPDHLIGRDPSGELLSPRIDFPHPGSTVSIGSTFTAFFADTISPPDAVAGLQPQNFILRNTALLKVTSELDRTPATSEINIAVGVGCDDGHYLIVGNQFLGSSPDHGFAYFWTDLAFEAPGLYPVYLLFAANSSGVSGLELSWNTAAGTEIIPQSYMYQVTPECDRDIYFEEYPAGTIPTDQYRDLGVLFNVTSGDVQITDAKPTEFVPVSGDRVLGDPAGVAAAPGQVELQFVVPATDLPGATNLFTCYVIDAEATGATITAYDLDGVELYSSTHNAGGATQERVDISVTGMHRIIFDLGDTNDTVALDNICFLTPYAVGDPDLVVDAITPAASPQAYQSYRVDYTARNDGQLPASGSWVDRVSMSTDDQVGGDTLLGEYTHASDVAVGATYDAFVESDLDVPPGQYWVVVELDVYGDLVEGDDQNNALVYGPISVGPQIDFQVTDITVPCAGNTDDTIRIEWTVTNHGPDAFTGAWYDELWLSDDDQVGNDTSLGQFAQAGMLAAGESYTASEVIVLPAAATLNHWIIATTDVFDDVTELDAEGNNTTVDDASFRIQPVGVVDLCDWIELDYAGNGAAGDWVVSSDGTTVHQRINGQPTYFVSSFDLAGSQFQGSFMVQSGAGDDDFIGFVFGFKGLGGTAVGEGYYLVSWKKNNQNVSGLGERGFKLMKIIGDNPNFWDGEPTAGQIVQLARKTYPDPNAVGWQHGEEYDFFLTYQENGNIRVIIKDAAGDELWNTGLINDPTPLGAGAVGFWNYSQANVIYESFTQAELQPPVADAGGPYTFDALTNTITVDALGSFDPDGEIGGFDDIATVQWDLGDDGIGDDPGRTNAEEIITLTEALGKGLSLTDSVPISLEVSDVDGLLDSDVEPITYVNTPPTADAGAAYGPLEPGQELQLAGFVDDLDLSVGVGEVLTIEWDFAPATTPGQMGDGFASTVDAVVSYDTLRPLFAQYGDTIYLNVMDAAGEIVSSAATLDLRSPDLAIIEVVAPEIAVGGDSIIVEYTVENVGTYTIDVNWQDALYLSDDATLSGDDDLLRLSPLSEAPLVPGERYTISRTITLPVSYVATSAYVIVETDYGDDVAELDEVNNVAASAEISISITPAPDLIGAITDGPASGIFGTDVTVVWEAENFGTATAESRWTDLVFLSTDTTLDSGDRFLGNVSIDVAPLAPGDPPYVQSLTAPLPLDLGTTPGDYYIVVKLDGNNAIEELSEENNITSFGPFYVDLPPLPNLVVENVVGPANAARGETVTVDWDVRNSGGEPVVGSFLMTVYASKDTAYDSGDTPLANVAFEDGLAVGAAAPASANVTVPELRTSELYFIVCADTVQDILEVNEDDNCTAADTAMVYDRPDLTVAPFTPLATGVAEGTVNVQFTVENIGTADANPYWVDGIYLSTDQVYGNDILVKVQAYTEALADGDSYNVDAIVGIPTYLEGDYYFVVETDRGNRVIESGPTTNNYRIADTTTSFTQPDRPNLIVSDIVTPATGVLGQEFMVEWTIMNAGLADAGGIWMDRVIASPDMEVGDGDDIVLGDVQNPTDLIAGATYTRQATFRYPEIPGDYYIIITTDIQNSVNEGFEGDENDNTSADDGLFTVGSFTAVATTDVEDAPAGTPVSISGIATVADTRSPAVDVPVVVRVNVRGFERRLADRTDPNGAFSVEFLPGPTEGGLYSIAAGPGHETGLPVTDEFRLWSLVSTPREIITSTVPGIDKIGTIKLKNTGDLPQTNITTTLTNVPEHVTIDLQFNDRADLEGLETKDVTYTIRASADTPLTEPIFIDFASDQGATARTTLWLTVGPALPTLIVEPDDLDAGKVKTTMIRGDRSFVEFRVRNVGGGSTGALEVQLPPVPWITLATPAVIGPLAPDAQAAVVLQLDPPADLTFGEYNGSVFLSGPNASLNVPFTFVATSDEVGDLRVTATDEYTYYAEGFPKVAGATVKVYDYLTGDLIGQDITDPNGVAVFENLTEAYYDLEVRAPDHGKFSTNVLVEAATTTSIEAFMPREVVSYSWTVESFDYDDEYTINIQADFETNVPAPVVVIEPAAVDLDTLEVPTVIEYTITNYGLVTAENVELTVPETNEYELTPLVTEIGDLPGGCTPDAPFGPCRVVVPVLITAKEALPASTRSCGSSLVFACHQLECGDQVFNYCAPSIVYHGTCPPSGGGYGGGGYGGGGGFGGGSGDGGGGDGGPTFDWPTGPRQDVPCDPCKFKCALSALGCIPGAGCGVGLAGCGIQFNANSAGDAVRSTAACVGAVINCFIELTVVGDLLSCACSLLRDCHSNCSATGNIPCSVGDIISSITNLIVGKKTHLMLLDEPAYDQYVQQYQYMMGYWTIFPAIFGDAKWVDLEPDDAPAFQNWVNAWQAASESGSEDGQYISATEWSALLTTPYPSQLTEADVIKFLERWNRSLDYWDAKIFVEADVPDGWSLDFIRFYDIEALHDFVVEGEQAAQANGFTSLTESFEYAQNVLIADQTEGGEGLCATVRISIDQTLTVTRTAFRATLELDNNGSEPLEAIFVDVYIEDENGDDRTSRFGVFPPELNNLNVDGTGSLAGGDSGSASWVILPTDEAAPLEPTQYYVGGTMMYEIGGELVTVPLFPVQITVLPNPNLELKYFLERVVYSDDPFTPELEPAIPFSLGLLIENSGAGIARNLKITSAQPEIIENERGLLIDFDIIGTQVGLNPVTPSLTVNFGDLGPGIVKQARWLLISTLQGEFVSFDASFEHVNPLGDPRLSLIESVDIFGLDHVVLADESSDPNDPNDPDLLPDFLTDDFADFLDMPDRVHMSDGTVREVTPISTVSVTPDPNGLAVIVDAVTSSGWFYIRLDDPFDAQYQLSGVTRMADGKEIQMGYNAWQTERVDRGTAGSPVLRYVHIFDRGGDGRYRLTFDPDSTPPSAISWQSVQDHGATLGAVGLAVPTSGVAVEPRLPGIEQLVVTFDEAIDPNTFGVTNIFVDGFDLANEDVDLTGVTITTELRQGGKVGVINFAPALPSAARYCVQLIGVTDRTGLALVGDGSRVDIAALPGDVTGDLRTNNTDVGAVASLVGADPTDRDVVNEVRSDLNCDGVVDQTDVDVALAARGLDARLTSNPCLSRQPAGKSGGDYEKGDRTAGDAGLEN